MSDLQGELISFSVIAIVVLMLAYLTAKLEKRNNSD